MGQRRKSREWVIQLLFQAELNPEKDLSRLWAGFWLDFGCHESQEEDSHERARTLFFEVWNKRYELDHYVEEVSQNWKIARMSLIDRNILRLATYELLYCPDVPLEVVLDEAIEIAKRFGAEDSGSFVNGILDQIGKREPRGKLIQAGMN